MVHSTANSTGMLLDQGRDSIGSSGVCPSPRDTTKLIEVRGGEPYTNSHTQLMCIDQLSQQIVTYA